MKFTDSLFFSDKFWKLLSFIEAHPKQICTAAQISNELEIDAKELTDYFSFLGLFQLNINIFKSGNEIKVEIGELKNVKFELSISEWLSLQGHFPLLEGFNGKTFNTLLKEKLHIIEEENIGTSLYDALEIENELQESRTDNSVSFSLAIEEINQAQNIAELTMTGEKYLDIFPHKLVHIDGFLNVVGEEIGDGCLVHIPIGNIVSVVEKEKGSYSPNFSVHELNDFIQALRTVSGSEERLVLKMKDQNKQEFKTGYHFMADPYITTNMDGDVIWAASVELSDELYEWLYQLGDKVEILDPTSIRDGYANYLCSKNNPQKKAA
ncbi:MAG: WYL domain-containing protein [Bacteriovoracaceae bacterium]|jgi:hypothetical protein|nr:WYL domain-containing protein [Bacteriovoracaceae bacterium]